MSSSNNDTTIVLGDEYDSTLRSKVVNLLKDLGASFRETSWGVAGSQEVSTLEFTLSGKPIVLEAETFIGLTIRGDQHLVTQIANQVKELNQ